LGSQFGRAIQGMRPSTLNKTLRKRMPEYLKSHKQKTGLRKEGQSVIILMVALTVARFPATKR
jgi:hypothetical protein